MTFDATPRRAPRPWTAWIAGLAALLALAVLAWAALGGSRGDGERGGEASGPRRAATLGAVEAVALAPEIDPGPAGRLGGPGSVVVEGPPGPALVEDGPQNAGARRAARARPRSQPRRESRPERPSYRVIGPTADQSSAPPASDGA